MKGSRDLFTSTRRGGAGLVGIVGADDRRLATLEEIADEVQES